MEEDDAVYHREMRLSELVAAFTNMFSRLLAADGCFDVLDQFKQWVFSKFLTITFSLRCRTPAHQTRLATAGSSEVVSWLCANFLSFSEGFKPRGGQATGWAAAL